VTLCDKNTSHYKTDSKSYCNKISVQFVKDFGNKEILYMPFKFTHRLQKKKKDGENKIFREKDQKYIKKSNFVLDLRKAAPLAFHF